MRNIINFILMFFLFCNHSSSLKAGPEQEYKRKIKKKNKSNKYIPLIVSVPVFAAGSIILYKLFANKKVLSPEEKERIEKQKAKEEEERLKAPKGLICPICKRIFKNPVTTKYGNSYCRECIKEWLLIAKVSPQNNQKKLDMSGVHKASKELKTQLKEYRKKNTQMIRDGINSSPPSNKERPLK